MQSNLCFLKNENNLKEENNKLNSLISVQNFKLKVQQKDVGWQVSIGSSWMANEASNKGTIGKFYKDMFPSYNQREKDNNEVKEI